MQLTHNHCNSYLQALDINEEFADGHRASLNASTQHHYSQMNDRDQQLILFNRIVYHRQDEMLASWEYATLFFSQIDFGAKDS